MYTNPTLQEWHPRSTTWMSGVGRCVAVTHTLTPLSTPACLSCPRILGLVTVHTMPDLKYQLLCVPHKDTAPPLGPPSRWREGDRAQP